MHVGFSSAEIGQAIGSHRRLRRSSAPETAFNAAAFASATPIAFSVAVAVKFAVTGATPVVIFRATGATALATFTGTEASFAGSSISAAGTETCG